MKRLILNNIENVKIFLVAIFFLAMTNNAYSQDLENMIERTIILDSKSEIEIKESSNKVSDYNIKRGKKNNAKNIQIDVSSSKNSEDNIDIKLKEKFAYNAFKNNQTEVAIELYKRIIKDDPQNIYALSCLALIYQKNHQFADAKNIYYKMMKDENQNRDILIENIISIMIEESPREAIYFINKLKPSNDKPYLFAQLGMTYNKIKQYNKAVEFLEIAVKRDDSRIDYKYNLAINYDHLKNYENAMLFYQKVIQEYELNPVEQIAIESVKLRLETIKNNI